jgi:micrococcal nuclease
VNESLVKAGLAWQYRKYCKAGFCHDWFKYEDLARSAELGLWKDPQPVAPWEWRKGKRSSASQKTKATPGQYHGNVKSHVFHDASCKYFNCKNCVIGFRSRQEAVDAGYRPGGGCKP